MLLAPDNINRPLIINQLELLTRPSSVVCNLSLLDCIILMVKFVAVKWGGIMFCFSVPKMALWYIARLSGLCTGLSVSRQRFVAHLEHIVILFTYRLGLGNKKHG